MKRFTLYSKPGCCLCDKAKAALEQFAKEYPLRLEVVDISERPELDEYKNDIPVLLIEGHEAARHHIGIEKLRVLVRRLDAAGT